MVNFPPTIPVGQTPPSVKKNNDRRIVPTIAADKKQSVLTDRRGVRDRRSRRRLKQIMDRRSGADRRRSSINLSI